jgi:hypothetical protein
MNRIAVAQLASAAFPQLVPLRGRGVKPSRVADCSSGDNRTVPPLVDDPEIGGSARPGELITPVGQPWLEAYEQTLGQALHPAMLQAAE